MREALHGVDAVPVFLQVPYKICDLLLPMPSGFADSKSWTSGQLVLLFLRLGIHLAATLEGCVWDV